MPKVIVILDCQQCPHHTRVMAAFDCYKTQKTNPNYPAIPADCPLDDPEDIDWTREGVNNV